ncbi:MAG: fibrobacter succinogenes major paralogous domain-containing protein [Candidatus Aminicenantes bacterium]|nr:MAG: fibrobacter succinogenes major paralogous domain-containing protein [Candidatus Aminicenantes bacterium]
MLTAITPNSPMIITDIDVNANAGTVKDIDGNTYKIIKIGDQEWMAENLKVTRYRNGDKIPNVTDNSEWASLSTGARCVHNNDESRLPTYGYLYNWYAVVDSRGIAPEGWHVPTDEDWIELEIYLGMSLSEAGDINWRSTDVGGKLKEEGTSHWKSPNKGATNATGFSALPGAFRASNGMFYPIGEGCGFWTSTECDRGTAWNRAQYYKNSAVYRYNYPKKRGFYVRCVRNK